MMYKSLVDLINAEKDGIIFAKISKSKDRKDLNGGYYDYRSKIGEILDCRQEKIKSNGRFFTEGTTTIEPIRVALGYSHYGDQITICNFTKLKGCDIEFSICRDSKPRCYSVSHVYIEKVMDLKDKSTIDYIMANTDKEYWNDLGINGYLYHLRRQGLEDIADYLEECVKAL